MEFSASEDTVVQLPDWSFCLDDTSVAEKSLLAKTFVLLSSFLVDFSIGASWNIQRSDYPSYSIGSRSQAPSLPFNKLSWEFNVTEIHDLRLTAETDNGNPAHAV